MATHHSSGCFSGLLSSLRTKKRLGRSAEGTTSTTSGEKTLVAPTAEHSARHDSVSDFDSDVKLKFESDPTQHASNNKNMDNISTGDHSTSLGAVSKYVDVDSLPIYEELISTVFDEAAVKTLEESIDQYDKELRELSLKIHDHPELGFEEKYAHDTLTEFMSSHGFTVTPHYLNLDTAWRAVWSNSDSKAKLNGGPGRTIGFNSEMDALPGIGHACGHNLIAIGGVAASLGVKAALEKHGIAGTVILLGTPAEEGGNGKVTLIQRGAYKPMDACLMMHPSGGEARTCGTGISLAIQRIDVEFFGKTAHAAGAPWEGQNALDAAFLAYSSISVLRQQIKPTHRVHGIVSGKDWAPNVIPDYAMMRWLIRAPTKEEVEALRPRVLNCFEAAALATACTIKIELQDDYAFDLRQNAELADEFAASVGRHGFKTSALREGAVGGSTDFGNVTYELPSLHPSYAIPTTGGNHTRDFTDAAAKPEAHQITLTVAKGIATAGLRVLADDEYYAKVKKAYDEEFGKHLA